MSLRPTETLDGLRVWYYSWSSCSRYLSGFSPPRCDIWPSKQRFGAQEHGCSWLGFLCSLGCPLAECILSVGWPLEEIFWYNRFLEIPRNHNTTQFTGGHYFFLLLDPCLGYSLWLVIWWSICDLVCLCVLLGCFDCLCLFSSVQRSWSSVQWACSSSSRSSLTSLEFWWSTYSHWLIHAATIHWRKLPGSA